MGGGKMRGGPRGGGGPPMRGGPRGGRGRPYQVRAGFKDEPISTKHFFTLIEKNNASSFQDPGKWNWTC